MSTLGLLWRMNYYCSPHRLIGRECFLLINRTPHDSKIGGRFQGKELCISLQGG